MERRGIVHPSKVFAQTIRKYDEKKKDFIIHLEKFFKLFLENSFFIPAENKSPKQIIRSLKKYCPIVYRKYRDKLFQVLGELQYFQKKTPGTEECFKLKQTCFNLVFEMDRERYTDRV